MPRYIVKFKIRDYGDPEKFYNKISRLVVADDPDEAIYEATRLVSAAGFETRHPVVEEDTLPLPHTAAALKTLDEKWPALAEALEAAQPDGHEVDVENNIRAEELTVNNAFYEDTKSRSNREQCLHLNIELLRQLVAEYEKVGR